MIFLTLCTFLPAEHFHLLDINIFTRIILSRFIITNVSNVIENLLYLYFFHERVVESRKYYFPRFFGF